MRWLIVLFLFVLSLKAQDWPEPVWGWMGPLNQNNCPDPLFWGSTDSGFVEITNQPSPFQYTPSPNLHSLRMVGFLEDTIYFGPGYRANFVKIFDPPVYPPSNVDTVSIWADALPAFPDYPPDSIVKVEIKVAWQGTLWGASYIGTSNSWGWRTWGVKITHPTLGLYPNTVPIETLLISIVQKYIPGYIGAYIDNLRFSYDEPSNLYPDSFLVFDGMGDSLTSIYENPSCYFNKKYLVFPIPCKNWIWIYGKNRNKLFMYMYDNRGRKIGTLTLKEGWNKIYIPAGVSGVYFLELEKKKFIKIIKIK